MARRAWKQILSISREKGSMYFVVLFWTLAIAGCQSGSRVGDRPILPLFAPLRTSGLSCDVTLGSPIEMTAPEIILAGNNQNSGVKLMVETKEDKESLQQTFNASDNIMRSCFVRDQIIDLDSVFRMANAENPTIGLAEEVVRAQLAERTMARSLLFPTLNVGTTLSLHQGSLLSARGVVQDVDRESLYFGAGADVRGAGTVAVPGVILVSNLGDAVFAPRVAEQKVISSRFDAVATRSNVLLQVAKTYLALAGSEASLLALRQSEIEFAEVAKLTSDFAAKGQGRDADAQRALSELSLVQSRAQRVEEDVIAWATETARLLSTDPSVRLRTEPGTPPLIQLVDDQIALENLIEMALTSRPEIAARSADVALYQTRLRQERYRPFVPTISVGFSAGNFGGGSNQTGDRISSFSGRTDFDVLAFWTLQNFGLGNRAVQNKVRAEVGQAEASRVSMIEQVRREVAEAFAQTKASRQQMEIAKRRVQTAQKAYRGDLLRTKNQIGNLVEVLSSLNLLSSARQDLVQAMVEYSQSQFQLFVALGRVPVASKSGDFGKQQ